MTRKQQETVFCQICKGEKKLNEVIPAELIHEPIVGTIRKTHPDWSPSGFICITDLNQFRAKYVKDVLETGKGELSTLEEQVVRSLKENELLSKNINIEFDQKLTFGERLADRIADFGGSWKFIVIFVGVLLLWVAANSVIPYLETIRPISIHPSQPSPFGPCCYTSSHYYDESKPPGGEGSISIRT